MTLTPPPAKRRYWLSGKRAAAQDQFFQEALDPDLWEPGDVKNWDALWHTGMPKAEIFDRLRPGQSVNHIPGNNGLTIKSRLAETLGAMRARVELENGEDSDHARRCGFFPDTFAMPQAYHAFQGTAHANPDARWILKPKNSARGQDISLVRDPAAVPCDKKWMVQRYLDNALLMNGHKHVLRLYVLITSADPLRAYLYHEGFAKLASEPYDLDKPFNVFSHLTNPDINATNARAAAPVVFLPFARYREWLRDQGHDDAVLFERLRDLVALTMISVREHMRTRLSKTGGDTSRCYELIGLDCLVDAELQPWILECNLSPSLEVCAGPEHGGPDEHRIKKQMVRNMAVLAGLNLPGGGETDAGERADPQEALRAEADAELARRGGWERLLPGETPESLLPFFTCPRAADMVLADAAAGRRVERPRLEPWRVREIIEDDRLSIFSEASGELYRLNEAAAFIWLKTGAGENPDEIADALIRLGGHENVQDAWRVRKQVWDQIADWAEAGLMRKRPASAPARPGLRSGYTMLRAGDGKAAPALHLEAGACRMTVHCGSQAVRDRLSLALAPFTAEASDGEARHEVVIARAANGYDVAVDGEIAAHGVLLAGLAPVLAGLLLSRIASAQGAGALECAVAAKRDNAGGLKGVVLISERAWDDAAYLAADALGASLGAGLVVTPDGGAAAPRFAARISEDLAAGLEEEGRWPGHSPLTRQIQIWPDGRRGRYLPAADARGLEAVDIRAVIFTGKENDEAESARAQEISAADALGRLLAQFDDGASRLEAVNALLAWLEERPCLTLDGFSTRSLTGMMEEWLA